MSVHPEVFEEEEDEDNPDYPAGDSPDYDDDGDVVMDSEEVMLDHMQEVIPRLWIGDMFAAQDADALEAAGITSIVTILRQTISHPSNIRSLPIPIDDGPTTDILSHLPKCVDYIQECLDDAEGGVLVHCQAGMSRSATVVAAYLMKKLGITPDEALAQIREKRSVIEPSDNFRLQLEVYHNASCKVSRKDRGVRQFYMERNASQVMNEGEAAVMDNMAKYPATPSASTPATPAGGHGRRKIRCKMCRRHLATREHMMDHILDQSPLSRPRTPSLSLLLPAPLTSSENSVEPSPRSRPPSISQLAKPPPSSLMMSRTAEDNEGGANGEKQPSVADPRIERSVSEPGAVVAARKHLDAATLNSRLPPQLAALRAGLPSSNAASSPQPIIVAPVPRPATASANGLQDSGAFPLPKVPSIPGPSPGSHAQTKSLPAVPFAKDLSDTPLSMSPAGTPARRDSMDNGSSLPARGTIASLSGLSMTRESSPDSTASNEPERKVSEGQRIAARRLSMMALTPATTSETSLHESAEKPVLNVATGLEGHVKQRERSGSSGSGTGTQSPSIPTSGPAILVNPKCSGYFVEPLTWMEPILEEGRMAGKILCPNEKCKAKIGSYDWAGVQCGCKEWVIPGFCIHRSKVDEVW